MNAVPEDLTALSDEELIAQYRAAMELDGGKDADGWPLPHPDFTRIISERNRRDRERASVEQRKRVRDIQLRSLVGRRR